MNLKKISKLGWGSMLLAGSSLLSRLLGIVRDSLFANYFGSSSTNPLMDINTYFAAFKLPDLIYTLLVMGALSAAFIPMYSEIRSKSPKKADEFANSLLNTLLLILSFSLILVGAFTPQIISVLLPGYGVEQLAVTVNLVRIMLIAPVLFTFSSVFQGIENVHKRFLGIALAPVLYNIGIILACVLFAKTHGVYALAWGAVLGAFLHAAAQVPGAIRCGFRYQWIFKPKSKKMKEFLALSIPRIFGLSATQLSLILDLFFTSVIGGGALAVYTYSNNIQSLAYGVIGVSVSIAVFSSLSEHANKDTKHEFTKLIEGSTRSILFWLVPSILGIFVLSEALIEAILFRGEFTMADVQVTAQTARVFIWAALGQSLIPLYARAFYSMKNTKTPVLMSIASIALAAISSLIGIFYFHAGVWVLALSACISASVNALGLFLLLKKELGFKISAFFKRTYAFTLIHGALMLFAIQSFSSLNYPNPWVEIFVIATLGAAVYLGGHTLTKTNPRLQKD